MAGQPGFTHIHSSSRFSRPVSVLEADLDDFMAHSSLITMTEVGDNRHASMLAEKGWRYFNASKGHGADQCAIAWDTSVWQRKDAWARQISKVRYLRAYAQKPGAPFWCANALLKHIATNKTLLVSVCHMIAHVQGARQGQHWRSTDAGWQARKEVYADTMRRWSDLVLNLEKQKKPDAVLISADWNLNLKDTWVRDFLGNHWKRCGLQRAWTDFPTSGGSMGGNRIIDFSYYSGMKISDGPSLMHRVRSSDHRPYQESFALVGGASAGVPQDYYNPATGHIEKGKEWWGFGDYAFDEMFEKVRETEEGTVVTFDFEEPPY